MVDFDAIARRPAAYLAETGVPQLSGGLSFVFLGSSILIRHLLPSTTFYMLGAQYSAVFFALTVLLGTAAIKRKLVFPRGGYVVPLGRTPRLLYLGLTMLFAVAMWAFVLASPGHRFDLLESPLVWPGFAIVIAVICLSAGWQQKSAPALYFGVYLACLAPLLWWAPVTPYEQGACLQVAAGAPLAVAGAVRLRRFLMANPIPREL